MRSNFKANELSENRVEYTCEYIWRFSYFSISIISGGYVENSGAAFAPNDATKSPRGAFFVSEIQYLQGFTAFSLNLSQPDSIYINLLIHTRSERYASFLANIFYLIF